MQVNRRLYCRRDEPAIANILHMVDEPGLGHEEEIEVGIQKSMAGLPLAPCQAANINVSYAQTHPRLAGIGVKGSLS